jgi:hypothetical protein
MKKPNNNNDQDDYDSIEQYIADAMADGYTIEADDFEGRECACCGEIIPFTDWPNNVVQWDIGERDMESNEDTNYFYRYYFCSEDCKKDAQELAYTEGWPVSGKYGHPDHIAEENSKGMI